MPMTWYASEIITVENSLVKRPFAQIQQTLISTRSFYKSKITQIL